MTPERKLKKVTIDYTQDGLGINEIEAEVLTHLHNVDGSQIILLKTQSKVMEEGTPTISNIDLDDYTFNTKER